MDSTRSEVEKLVVWHPLVHGFYGEELHFFMLKFDVPFNPEFVRKCLIGAKIQGFCIYPVFGSYDLVIRAWVDSDKRQKFVSALKDDLRFEEFIAFHIDYLWSDSKLEGEAVKKELAEIRSEGLRAAQDVRDQKLVDRLLDVGMILKISDTSVRATGIKFFTLFRFEGQITQELIGESLKEQSRSLGEKLKEVSIYRGNGVAQFIVKAVAREFYDISDFILGLRDKLKLVKIATETFLVAVNEFPMAESDHVDFRERYDPEETTIVSQALGINEDELDCLSKLERQILYEKIIQARDGQVLKLAHAPVLVELMKTILITDSTKRDQELSKVFLYELVSLEHAAREYLVFVMNEHYGSQWLKNKLEEVRKSVEITTKKWQKFTQMDVVCCLGWVDRHEEKCVTAVLGQDWERVLREAVDWRNDVAHARLIPNWQDIIDFEINLLPVHDRLLEKGQH